MTDPLNIHKSAVPVRLEYLDGLRGIAALWVFTGHLLQTLDIYIPVLINAGYAVDLFMIISGFLMYFQASARSDHEPMTDFKTWWIFWTRRFFRIAPLYYVVLTAAFLLGPVIYLYSESLPQDQHIAAASFLDRSWQNMLAHYSFTFGMIPAYHNQTFLPDWSIGLEMQFYAIFPILFLGMMKLGHIKTAIFTIAIAIAIWVFQFDFLESFALPSFFFMKANMFLCGMLVCAAMKADKKAMWSYLFFAAAIAGIPLADEFGFPSMIIRMGLIGGFAVLAIHHRLNLHKNLSALITWFSSLMGNRFFHWMGEMSYSVYLIHVFFILSIGSYLSNGIGAEWSKPTLLLVDAMVCLTITYLLAWVLHITIEKPGISMGKKVVSWMKTGRASAPIEQN